MRGSEPNIAGSGCCRGGTIVPGFPQKAMGWNAFAAEAMLDEGGNLGPLEEGDESFDENDLPAEILEAEHEAFGMHYKAKQRIAEIKKLRQFYKKPVDNEERRKAISEKMKTNPCHTCGQLGHWSRECPMRTQAVLASASSLKDKGASQAFGVRHRKELIRAPFENDDWELLRTFLSEPSAAKDQPDAFASWQYPAAASVHRVCTTVDLALSEVLRSMQDLAFKVIVDLGCMRSVAGVGWVNMIVRRWRAEGQWFRVTEESEVFKFGDGEVLTSKFRIELAGSFAGKPVVYGFSVVEGCCPPLFSRAGCSAIGAVIDCELHTLSSRKLKVKSYGLGQERGHYTVPVDESSFMLCLPSDFSMPSGVDIVPLCPEVLRCQGSPRLDTSANSTTATHGREGTMRDGHRGIGQQLPPGGADRSRLGGGPTPSQPRRVSAEGAGPEIFYGAASSTTPTPVPASLESAGLTAEEVKLLIKRRERQAIQGEGQQGPDREPGRLPHPLGCLELRAGLQHDRVSGQPDEDLHVEEASVAAEGEGGDRKGEQEEVEAQPTVAGSALLQKDCLSLRPLRGDAAEDERSASVAPDVKDDDLKVRWQRPGRGITQKLKAGVKEGLRVIEALNAVVKDTGKWKLLEIFAGKGERLDQWEILERVDILGGWDLLVPESRRQLLDMIRSEKPDLVTMALLVDLGAPGLESTRTPPPSGRNVVGTFPCGNCAEMFGKNKMRVVDWCFWSNLVVPWR